MKSGAIDYLGLLRAGLEELDFYDSRRHLYTRAGADLVVDIRIRAAALRERGLRRGDRVAMTATSDEEYLATLLAVLLLGAVPCAIAPPPTPSRPDSAGVAHLRAALEVLSPAMVIAQPRVMVAVVHQTCCRTISLRMPIPLTGSYFRLHTQQTCTTYSLPRARPPRRRQ